MVKEKGFTLVEIMIVVGVIALLATLTIPQMVRSKVNSNEVAAVANMRTFYNSCQSFYGNSNPHRYPNVLADLTTPTSNPPYMNRDLANAINIATAVAGYYYTYTPLANQEAFTIVAQPSSFGRTGARNFFVDEMYNFTFTVVDGVLPDASSPPIQY